MAAQSGFYEAFYARGDHKSWRDAPGKLVVLSAILESVHDGAKLLDVGCGDGYFLNRVATESGARGIGIAGVGVDFAQRAIELARVEYPTQAFDVMDAQMLEFADRTFDITVSYGVFEHLADPGKAIHELARVMIPGGRFFLLMPTVGYYRDDRLDQGWYEDLNVPPQMQWNWDRPTWERLFGNAGLELDPIDAARRHGANKPGNFYFGTKP